MTYKDGKQLKTARRTVAVIVLDDDLPVSSRALAWEDNARTGSRTVHRVEYLGPGAGVDDNEYAAGALYLIDMEITCKGANRHDFTKFVRTYLPEVDYHYITE